MKTLKIEKVDGIQIVKGFMKLPVDSAATKNGPALELIKSLPEVAQIQAKAREGAENMRKGFVEKKKAHEFRKIKNSAQADIHSGKCKDYFGAANICNDAIKEIQKKLAPKQKEILRNNAVYFEPRLNEVILSELEIADLELKLLDCGQNQKLKIDGSIVDDFRGVSYNKKISGTDIWGKVIIDKLGVKIPKGGKLDVDLTDTDKIEIEAGRVSMLSAEDKTAEKENAVNAVMTESIKMKSELEIKADPAALTKSQDFYNGEVAKIESKYK